MVDVIPLQRKFVKFTENNDNEGESWNFWLQLDGNEESLQRLKDEIDSTSDQTLSDSYKLDLTPVPENDVNVLVRYSRRGYMMYENKVVGKFVFEVPTDDEVNDFHDTKAEYYYEKWYKGGLAEKFLPIPENETVENQS